MNAFYLFFSFSSDIAQILACAHEVLVTTDKVQVVEADEKREKHADKKGQISLN